MITKFKINSNGFTLIELLVVMALLSILVTVGTETVLSLIRSNSKTNVVNEAKQNGQVVLEKFEKDARGAKRVSPFSGIAKSLSLVMPDDTSVIYACVDGGSTSNDYISRSGVSVTNTDVNNGVNAAYANCSFNVVDTGSNRKIINFDFILTEPKNRVTTAAGRAEYKVDIPFSTTITIRNF